MNHLRKLSIHLCVFISLTSCYTKRAIIQESSIYGNNTRILPVWQKKPTYFRTIFRFSFWGGLTGYATSRSPIQGTVNGKPTEINPAITGSVLGLLVGGIAAVIDDPKYKNTKVHKNHYSQWVKDYNKENLTSYAFGGNDGDYLLLKSDEQRNIITHSPEVIRVEEVKKETDPVLKNRHAFVIGNSHYKSQNLIPNAINDINDVSEKLKGVGFNVLKVEDFTNNLFDEKWTEFKQIATGTEVLLIYYVGHSMAYEGNNYLLPIEASLKYCESIRKQGIKVSELINDISKINAKVNLFYMDSFQQKNKITCIEGITSMDDDFLQKKRGVRLAEKANLPTLMFYNAAKIEGAIPSTGNNGYFTKAFLENIKPGISTEKLMSEITKSVYGNTNQKQQPESSGSSIINFIF